MLGELQLIIANPDRFFQTRTELELRHGLFVVLFAGLTATAGTGTIFYQAFPAINSAPTLTTVIWIATLVSVLLGPLVSWFLYSILFYFISKWFNSEPGFRSVLENVAWGFVPKIFSGLINAAIVVVVTVNVQFPNDPSSLGPFIRELTSGPMFKVGAVLGIVVTCWSGMIWIFALKNSRDLTVKQAVYTVSLPLSVGLLYQIYNFI